jgi:hypothetical protein
MKAPDISIDFYPIPLPQSCHLNPHPHNASTPIASPQPFRFAYNCIRRRVYSCIDYYGVTFDHLVPADNPDPEVLAIYVTEVDSDRGVNADDGKYANEVLLFSVNPIEYTGKKVLAVPRCCQYKGYARS